MVEVLEGFERRFQKIVEIFIVGVFGIDRVLQVAVTLKVLLYLLDAFSFVSIFRAFQVFERMPERSCLRKERGKEEEERRKRQ